MQQLDKKSDSQIFKVSAAVGLVSGVASALVYYFVTKPNASAGD